MAPRILKSSDLQSLPKDILSLLPDLKRSSILFIKSSLPPNISTSTTNQQQLLSQFIDKTSFFLSHKFTCYPKHVYSSFPTINDIESSMHILQRSGCKAVVGVGSGVAMDLAKAVSDESTADLILIPGTLGGALASSSEKALILDTNEEALVLPSRKEQGGEISRVICMDSKEFKSDIQQQDPSFVMEAMLACLAIGVDASYSLKHYPVEESKRTKIFEHVAYLLQNLPHKCTEAERTELVTSLLLHTGSMLNYGMSQDSRRSIPLALASALLPPHFPHGHIFKFWASLLPALSETLKEQEEMLLELQQSVVIPSLAELAEGAPDVNAMVDLMNGNEALWNCMDEESGVLEQVLYGSLNR